MILPYLTYCNTAWALEKGVVIYGANALSLLPVVLFVLPINVHV